MWSSLYTKEHVVKNEYTESVFTNNRTKDELLKCSKEFQTFEMYPSVMQISVFSFKLKKTYLLTRIE